VDELSPAAIIVADAGVCVRRARTRACGVSGGDQRRLSVLQLWRCHVDCLKTCNSKFRIESAMIFSYEEFDLSGIKTYPLKSRRSKVTVSDFARPSNRSTTIGEFVDSRPDLLAAADLKAIVSALATAKRTDSGILWGLGAHVIKTGLGPAIVELMRRGFVSAVA